MNPQEEQQIAGLRAELAALKMARDFIRDGGIGPEQVDGRSADLDLRGALGNHVDSLVHAKEIGAASVDGGKGTAGDAELRVHIKMPRGGLAEGEEKLQVDRVWVHVEMRGGAAADLDSGQSVSDDEGEDSEEEEI